MCGIFGIIPGEQTSPVSFDNKVGELQQLFKYSLSRGSEAAGLAAVSSANDNEKKHLSASVSVKIVKENFKSRHFFKTTQFFQFKKDMIGEYVDVVIGHTRMSTNGHSCDNKNNQPVVSNRKLIVGVHNGIITNYKSLFDENDKSSDLDTQVLLDYLEKKIFPSKITTKFSHRVLTNKLLNALSKVEGTFNLGLIFPALGRVVLISNHGSLYYCIQNGFVYFASEKIFLKKLKSNCLIKQILHSPAIFNINPSKKRHISVKKFESRESKQVISKQFENSLSILEKHTINTKKIENLIRCSKCILPITTPFISFDENGVCNFCLEHQKISYKGLQSLDYILSKYRRSDGLPDCAVAFSGGRDSSYGLHLLKKELGMNPIAFTYDWGMISELGRRNQARMISKLQVEHILVSADITTKRRHIRKNILAWIKKPDLGMIPLFMQGDKQCEYYADKVMRDYNVPLMIYCRGNELEREEFKAGHCGVQDADPGGVIHDLSYKNKFKLLNYYGKQYLKNPSYINESFFETAFGYVSTYLQPHNYLYLWHYLEWNEKQIVETLTKDYDWELSNDTSTTWRIGDGTPAFYNYIYYQVQGFTENDSLRARQVREGIISRKRALSLVMQENKPQYRNLKWYFDTLNLDGDKVLTVVHGMNKLY